VKHRFTSLDSAVRQIRRLEKLIAWYELRMRQMDNQIHLLAKLASRTPEFHNPLEVMAAEKLRDEILAGRKHR
jgi:hypothetical protein